MIKLLVAYPSLNLRFVVSGPELSYFRGVNDVSA